MRLNSNGMDSCQECGCHCDNCVNNNRYDNSLHLHQEIEDLKKQLVEQENHILQMETNVILEANKYPNGQFFAMREEIGYWQEKFERLYDSHKKLQKVNQGLEDKLLKIVDKYETEKNALMKDVHDLTNRLVEARVTITELEEENDRYRNDCNLAVQLLQCKPTNFVSHKVDTLPIDLQQKVKHHLNQKRKDLGMHPTSAPDIRTIRVPIPTFPPTAMVYSVNAKVVQNGDAQDAATSPKTNDIVSAAIMAKVLEERAKEHHAKKHARCLCKVRHKRELALTDKETQTQSNTNHNLLFDHDMSGMWNVQSSNYPTNSRTRTESNSSYDVSSTHCWSRSGSTSSGTETQI